MRHKLSSRLVWWGPGRALEGFCLGQGHSEGAGTLKPIHRRQLSPYLPGTGFPSSRTHKNSHRDLGGRR